MNRTLPLISLLLLMGASSSGCVTQDPAAYHMYSSPLLEVMTYEHSETNASRQMAYLASGKENKRRPERIRRNKQKRQQIARKRPIRSQQNRSAKRRGRMPIPTTSGKGPSLEKKKRAKKTLPALSLSKRPATSAGENPNKAAAFVYDALIGGGIKLPEYAKFHIPKLYKACKKKGKISFKQSLKTGDVVFFHNTRDANGDRRNNDWYTHVALVTQVDASKTATLKAHQNGKVQHFRLNLKNPKNSEFNAQLRPHRDDDIPYTQYLAGELFAGTCRLPQSQKLTKK